jgi:hypothetical protein
VIQTYITFLFPGSFFANEKTEKVADRTMPVTLPDGAFGYQFFDREELTGATGTLTGAPFNHSGFTYFGRRMTLEEVKREVPDSAILQSNMHQLGKVDDVCLTVRGNFRPIHDGDTVIHTNLPAAVIAARLKGTS